MMLGWLENMPRKPRQIFVNHGEDQVTEHFAEHVGKALGVPAEAPYSGDCFDVLTGTWVSRAPVVKAVKRAASRTDTAFDRLVQAGKRLTGIIADSRSLSSKELARFTDQINALCERYLRK
jgi:metallo-beta-lactamase family protein